MRYAPLVLALLCAGSANGTIIFSDTEPLAHGTNSGNEMVMAFQIADSTGTLATWMLDGFETADAGTTWTLDETTADGFGVDWQDFVDWASVPIDGHTLRYGIYLENVGNAKTIDRPWDSAASDLQSITFELFNYSQTIFTQLEPNDSVLHEALSRFRVHGGPLVDVPEPASFTLLLVGWCLLARHSHTPKLPRK